MPAYNDEGFGPWIIHDGAAPDGIKSGSMVFLILDISTESGFLVPLPHAFVDANWPGFYWTKKTVRKWLFLKSTIRICDDPDYRPVLRYKIKLEGTGEMEKLRRIAAIPDDPFEGPEITPVKRRVQSPTEKTDGQRD